MVPGIEPMWVMLSLCLTVVLAPMLGISEYEGNLLIKHKEPHMYETTHKITST